MSGRRSAEYEDIEEHGMIAAAMGWIGTIGSISAYILLSRGQLRATSLRYSALNGIAGGLGGCASAVYGAWPSAASNLLWSAVAVYSAITTLRIRRAQAARAQAARAQDSSVAHPLGLARASEVSSGLDPTLLNAA